MVDRNDIENLLNGYSLAYDTPDLDAMEQCFTEGASFKLTLPGQDPLAFEPREAIMGLMRDSLSSQTDQRRHLNSNLIVHGTDDEGVTRTTHYLSLLATENGEISLLSAGVYRMEIVEQDGGLKLRSLDLTLDRPY